MSRETSIEKRLEVCKQKLEPYFEYHRILAERSRTVDNIKTSEKVEKSQENERLYYGIRKGVERNFGYRYKQFLKNYRTGKINLALIRKVAEEDLLPLPDINEVMIELKGLFREHYYSLARKPLAYIDELGYEIIFIVLKARYAGYLNRVNSLNALEEDSFDLPIKGFVDWVSKNKARSAAQFLRKEDILQDSSSEKTSFPGKLYLETLYAAAHEYKKIISEEDEEAVVLPRRQYIDLPQIFVEELHVTVEEGRDWVVEEVENRCGEIELILAGYKGEAKVITLPSSINGKAIDGLVKYPKNFVLAQVEEIKISAHYDKKIDEHIWFIGENLKKFVVGEGIRSINGQIINELKEGVKIEASTSLAALTGKEVYGFANKDFEVLGGLLVAYNGTDRVVNIPHGVRAINSRVLRTESLITDVIIPESVEIIHTEALFGPKVYKKDIRHYLEDHSEIENIVVLGPIKEVGANGMGKNIWAKKQKDDEIVVGEVLYQPNSSNSKLIINRNAKRITPNFLKSFNRTIDSVTLHENIEYIGESAFLYSSVKEVNRIPEGLSFIGSLAFDACKDLKEFIMPFKTSEPKAGYVPLIGRGKANFAFGGSGLRKVRLVGINEQDRTFRSSKNLLEVSLDGNIVPCSENMFAWCTSLEEIELPMGVKVIGSEYFIGCEKLKRVKIPEGVIEIGDSAFERCKSLEEIKLPASLKRIGAKAFKGCESLSRINISDYVEVGEDAFMDSNIFIIDSSEVEIKAPEQDMEAKEKSVRRKSSDLEKEVILHYYQGIELDNTKEKYRTNIFNEVAGSVYSPNSPYNQGPSKVLILKFKDKQDDETKYNLVFELAERYWYYQEVNDLWINNFTPDIAKYDELFFKMREGAGKLEMAFSRVEYPYKLASYNKRAYENYLAKYLLNSEESYRNFEFFTERVLEDDRLERMELIKSLGGLSEDALEKLKHLGRDAKAKKCLNFILNLEGGK